VVNATLAMHGKPPSGTWPCFKGSRSWASTATARAQWSRLSEHLLKEPKEASSLHEVV
jgi:hypothetical protein